MTVDVNVTYADDAFLDDIDDIMEETMVQMFILQPRTLEALKTAQEQAQNHTAIFYTAPLSLQEHIDAQCVGFFVDTFAALQGHDITKPLFVDAAHLEEPLLTLLKEKEAHGIILNATQTYETLEHFFLSLGPDTINDFDAEQLGQLSMERIVLQSSYPTYDFDQIQTTVKTISDAMFRPEQSIIAHATRSALTLMGFKKS